MFTINYKLLLANSKLSQYTMMENIQDWFRENNLIEFCDYKWDIGTAVKLENWPVYYEMHKAGEIRYYGKECVSADSLTFKSEPDYTAFKLKFYE